jgi:SAM-dependent methyltransferase
MSRTLIVPQALRRGALKGNDADYLESGRALIDVLCRCLGVPDLGTLRMLDMGCGTKLVQALLAYDLPVGHYTGVDLYREMIEHLSSSVEDPRFDFHHVDTHNAMYNPGGARLEGSNLPVPEGSFDLICLFSVFTHLEPHDYVAMLRLLRRYIAPDGMLVFSLFVNEVTAGGHGLIDGIQRSLRADGRADDAIKALETVPDFRDAGPGTLQWALYSRRHAFELLEGTGWKVESLHDPEKFIQHYFVCRPD